MPRRRALVARPTESITVSSTASTTVSLPPSAPPAVTSSTVITSILFPNNDPTVISTASAVHTTIAQILSTTTPSTTVHRASRTTTASPSSIDTALVGTTGTIDSLPNTSSSLRSTSSAVAAPSVTMSLAPVVHKSKNIGKYVGYTIGAVFLFALLSSFLSTYRRHRRYMRKRPRPSVFTGTSISNTQLNVSRKSSFAQALMRSVSTRSFDAYALTNGPPPLPPYLGGSQPSSLDITTQGGRPVLPVSRPYRPLPPTPIQRHSVCAGNPVVFHSNVPPPTVDPRNCSPHVLFSSGNSQTSDFRWHSESYCQ
ncbi:hypothetical protein R3P38DRAFT_1167380 [Favolaschia claudopus]|uniref:Transmembrane protein n=1 Tax=Favolaschia claudopus TaxID=2862362 RepID=A0AAW0E026_9AGAR